MRLGIVFLSLFFLLLTNTGFSQSTDIKVDWLPTTESISKESLFQFSNALSDGNSHYPYFRKRIALTKGEQITGVQIENVRTSPLTEEQIQYIKDQKEKPESTVKFDFQQVTIKGRAFLDIYFYPILQNKKVEEISFQYEYAQNKKTKTAVASFEDNSVLSQGLWYKIAITENGIYRISASDLSNYGIDINTIDPNKIRIFGNGGGLLPELNSEERLDDLVENPIKVVGQSDGEFNAGDYILFFGESPHKWSYDSTNELFQRQIHYYSDTTFYFLNFDQAIGKRINADATITGTPDYTTSSFDDYKIVEEEKYNLANTGKQWFGQRFEITKTFNYSFNFPDRIESEEVGIRMRVVARSGNTTSMNVKQGTNTLLQFSIGAVTGETVMKPGSGSVKTVLNGENLIFNVNFIENYPGAVAYLDFLEINARRAISMDNGQAAFRDIRSVGTGNISQFNISGSVNNTEVWDVTDIANIKSMPLQGSFFKANTSDLREFIMFNSTQFLSPSSIQAIPNQNLHGITQADFIIVTHPLFLSEAERLAEFHRVQDNMTAVVATTNQVYNEFSSGKQDITAIKDFVRMLYERNLAAGTEPKNLLLFGDASFDYKDITEGNSNFVPTWESFGSYNIDDSYATDDYFGMLDTDEGSSSGMLVELVDIGIGRFIVQNLDEAKIMVDKVENYYSSASFGNWRNRYLIVADDVDNPTWEHLLGIDANQLSNRIINQYPTVNVQKIFTDAYVQQSSSGGERYPDAENDINLAIENGALIVHYYGHGGEVGWASERILENEDILGYQNKNSLPLFITTTCEFSRYDDKDRISAGEYVLLNPDGAGIALYTTTRSISIGNANSISNSIYNFIYEKVDGKYRNLGELIAVTKNDLSSGSNKRKFLLLGDPALTLAFPEQEIITSQINDIDIANFTDTLKALSKVKISGQILNSQGVKDENFSGLVFPTVYDKFQQFETLNNDNPGEVNPIAFQMQNSILYNGKVQVTNGDFSFEFVIPKDAKLDVDNGKISYYASSTNADATGTTNDILIGSLNPNPADDSEGPLVQLFMNDESFVSGGYTNSSPDIFAIISDENGVNTAGTGIGHDITAILDDESDNIYILNDFYEGAVGDFTKGTVRYPLSDLESGTHHLQFKIWDSYNNSTIATTQFVVENDASMALKRVLNWPNPFTTSTDFQFEHNHRGENIEVQVQIFTISGKLVKTLRQDIVSADSRVHGEIIWDGLDDFGDKIGKGVYLYKIEVRSENSKKSDSKIEKLVILK